ncbi:MAG: cytochrome c [Planctomycetaceae bacterium]|nr:cytochrome c [Planctomycetaceae bacterium]
MAGSAAVGCSKPAEQSATATDATGAQTAAPTEPATTGDTGSKSDSVASAPARTHARDELWTDDKGQKWFGNVPLDAFFDSPYEVATDVTPVGGAKPETMVASNDSPGETTDAPKEPGKEAATPSETEKTPDPAPEKTTTETAASDGDSWDALISSAALDEEVKSIRTFLQENVSSVGNFNSSMMMIPPKAATLAALAEVARQQKEAVSWKDDAAYVRNLAKKMNETPLQRGAKDQKRLQELFEAMSDTLNRSKPAGLEEPPETDSFAEVADMRLLMKRMEDCEKIMKTEVASEAALGSKKDLILHEAALLGTLTKVVTLPGFGYEDDAEFKGYAAEIVTASQSLKAAADGGDFSGFEAAMSTVAQACQKCHSKYKND